jgi:MraZ protein
MLIGEYIHTIDAKNRVSLPSKFRKEMGKKIIITPGLDSCLFIFTLREWAKVSKRLSDSDTDLSFLKADKRSFNRFMFGRATDVEVDSIGRILIPDFLKDRIGLKDKATRRLKRNTTGRKSLSASGWRPGAPSCETSFSAIKPRAYLYKNSVRSLYFLT